MSAFWLDRPTLITGVTGLVGGWLATRLLEHKAQVVCLIRDHMPGSHFMKHRLDSQAMIVQGDVRDQELLERVLGEYEIQTVLHLAAQTIVPIANRNPVSTFETNIKGTWSLLEACRRSPKIEQIIIASSDKAYGEAQHLPYREETPLNAIYPYDVSKACGDMIARCYAATYKMPVAITRCGNFYGPGDLNWNRIIPGTIRSFLLEQSPVIRSDGSLVRDYMYIDDGISAYMTLAEAMSTDRSLHGESFNFSTQNGLAVRDIVSKLQGIMNSQVDPVYLQQGSGEIQAQTMSAQKARTQLSWSPVVAIDEGLQKTVEWYKAYFKEMSA